MHRAAERDAGDAWHVDAARSPADVIGEYRATASRTDAIARPLAPEAPLRWWPHEQFGPPHLHTLCDMLLHVVTETACHAGHLDAARELVDGRQWLVLD